MNRTMMSQRSMKYQNLGYSQKLNITNLQEIKNKTVNPKSSQKLQKKRVT